MERCKHESCVRVRQFGTGGISNWTPLKTLRSMKVRKTMIKEALRQKAPLPLSTSCTRFNRGEAERLPETTKFFSKTNSLDGEFFQFAVRVCECARRRARSDGNFQNWLQLPRKRQRHEPIKLFNAGRVIYYIPRCHKDLSASENHCHFAANSCYTTPASQASQPIRINLRPKPSYSRSPRIPSKPLAPELP